MTIRIFMEKASINLKVAIVLFGPTRSGKSSFLNLFLREGEFQDVGRKGGRSTTRQCKAFITNTHGLFPEKKMLIIDTIGLDDTDRYYSNEQICELVTEEIFKKSKLTSFYIIVFESLGNKNVLPLTYTSLVQMLGTQCPGSTTVLATKSDLAHRIMYPERRLKTIQDQTVKHKFSGFLPWSNVKVGDISKDPQMIALAQHLSRVEPFASDQLKSLKQCVEQLAQQLHAEAAPRKKQIQMNEAEQIKKQRTVYEDSVDEISFDRQILTYQINNKVEKGGACKEGHIQRVAVPIKKKIKDVKYKVKQYQKTVTDIIPIIKQVKKDIQMEKLPLWVFEEIAYKVIYAQFFGQ